MSPLLDNREVTIMAESEYSVLLNYYHLLKDQQIALHTTESDEISLNDSRGKVVKIKTLAAVRRMADSVVDAIGGTVGFLQAGAGAVPRSINNKISEDKVSTSDFVNPQQAAYHVANGGGGELFLPTGNLYLKSPLVPNSDIYSSTLRLNGSNRWRAKIVALARITTIYDRGGVTVSNLSLSASELGSKSAVGIGTNDTNQSSLSSFCNVSLDNFLYGFWFRFSMHNSYRDISLRGNVCGIRFASGSSNQSGGRKRWNREFFNNQNVMENVFVEGGEVGVWACTMGTTYIGLTCQNQKSPDSGNKVLPLGQEGTGLYLDSGHPGFRLWNDVVINYYTEGSSIGLYVKDRRYVSVTGMFSQGGRRGAPARASIIVDNSIVEINGLCAQDYFSTLYDLKNGSILYVNSQFGPASYEKLYRVDETSRIKPRGMIDKNKYEYSFDKKPGKVGECILKDSVPEFSTAKIFVSVVKDEAHGVYGECRVTRFNSNIPPEVRWMDSDSAEKEIAVFCSSSGVISMKFVGESALRGYVTLVILCGSEVSGNPLNLEVH
jgi:hypothetical protein